MSGNGFQSSLTSYANDRPPSSTGSGDADLASDPASSSFFMNDFKKHEDLKTMLDSNKDNLKLEAMKRIIGMIAKGKDASDLFPAVVKNVVSKNIEVKKLVYVYLVRYAEEQQDLALLSISTFQRALKDPNQLFRASALRVLSSIRVPVIVPIMMLAIKEAVMDMSPYVRKTAAHAIPKLYSLLNAYCKSEGELSLDPEQKEILIEVIEKLLGDKTTLVAGSAIQAFEEVCPERIDLIHKNYRKICSLLVDVEEWGQVVIINMLTRYCRTQFVSPNQEDMTEEQEKNFYASDDSDKEEEESKKKMYVMDPDHRLLLRTCKPLLNSRNAAVVMAVAQLYHHCAPKPEVNIVAKALVRLLRSHKEVQYVVLSNIATMSIKRKGMFEPLLKSFYVRSNDPLPVKLLKLEILTNLATETNISTILREFQTYVTSSDRDFAAATIQAIGRCASRISEITDACLNGLVTLMSNRDESVVAESVVVIKKLLQMQRGHHKMPTEHKDIIVHMAKLAEEITVPMARASILWLIGEYSDRVPRIAPDVLRKMAKNFIHEEDIVKLQILNLAGKLCITNSKQTKLLCQYVFNLAKYDMNYDIRDRVRFLRQLILPNDKGGTLAKHVKKIFLATKPAPVLESNYKDRDQFQLGTLSHLINTKAQEYQELPDWPEVAPDTSVRNVEVTIPWSEIRTNTRTKNKGKRKSFYSESESSPADESSETSGADSEGDTESDEDDDEEDDEDKEEKSDEEESTEEESDSNKESEEDSSSSSEESSTEEEESSSEEEKPPVKTKTKRSEKPSSAPKSSSKPTANNMLLDLDEIFQPASVSGTPVMTPGDVLTPSMASDLSSHSLNDRSRSPTTAALSMTVSIPEKHYELLNRMSTGGLSATYKFTRTISVFSPKMTSIELTFTNHSENPINNIVISNSKLQADMSLCEFPEINTLGTNSSISVIMSVDFNDTTQPAQFDVSTKDNKFTVNLKCPVGELVQPHTISENEFNNQLGKLTGMNEHSGNTSLTNVLDQNAICSRVYEAANVLLVCTKDDEYRFAARTLSSGALVLVRVRIGKDSAAIIINCEKLVIGSMLVKELKQTIGRP